MRKLSNNFPISNITFQSPSKSSFILLMYGLPIAEFSVKDLYSVTGYIDKDKQVSVSEVHPNPVRDYAAQSIESQVYVYRTVVEPVTMATVKAEHWSQISVPEDEGCHISLNAHRRAGGCPQLYCQLTFRYRSGILLERIPANPL